MTAVPTSAATTTINTFKPKVRILEVPPFKEGVIGQKRRFQENTPAALRGHRAALVVISGRAAMVPATAGRIQRTSSAPCVPVLSKPNP
jgi:hypothetical protein